MSTLADERHSLLTEAAVAAPPPPQQNRVPQQAAPIPQRQLPEPTPPAKPTVFKPTGPPIPALSGIGYWGSIHDFNAAVQAAHDGYVAANGVRPDPKTLLSIALKTPVTAGTPKQGPPFKTTLPPIGPQGHLDLLKQMKSITQGQYEDNLQRHKDFNDFIQEHSDVLQDMLSDPKTKAKTLAAINDTQADLDFHGQNPGKNPLSFGGFVKDIAVTFPKYTATYVGKAAFALTKDVDNIGAKALAVDQQGSRKSVHDLKQAATFPDLTKAAPAVAQVVKGLVYSPAGVASALIGAELDLNDAANWTQSGGKHGSPDFKRTQKLAKAYGQSLWADLNDPGGRAGYVFLDAFGLVSLGAGSFVRLGRAADAFGEAEAGSRVSSAIRAAAKPHDLKMVEYNKGGFTENISLLNNQFAAWVQQKTPHFGTDAQVRQLLDPMHDPMSWLREAKVGEMTYQRGRVVQAVADALDKANPFAPEARMGRAGSISRATEAKVMSANLRQIEDVAGWSVRKTVLDGMIPDRWFEGLTKGENKALQVAALDYAGDIGNKISAWETTHQFLIESKIGSRDAHMQQLAELALARKAIANPSARFLHALQVLRDTSTKAEQLRIAYGMPEQVATTGLLKPGLFVQYANEAAELQAQIKKSFENTSPPEMPAGVKEMELRLHNLKSFMGNLDVRYVPEGYKVPEFKPSDVLSRKVKELEKKQKTLDKTEAAEKEFIDAQRAKIDKAIKGGGREVGLDNKFRESIVSLNEVVASMKKDVALRTAREQAVHGRVHPPEGISEGYYAKIGGEFVPVNRQSDDSFYVPTLLRGGRTPVTSRGNVRLPGSVYGIGPNSDPIWNDYQMTGSAMMDGDFRTDTPHLIGQSFAATARAIPRFNAYNKSWAGSRPVDESNPLGLHDIYVRDVAEVSTEIRKAFQSLREGHITQEEVEGIPADLMEYLYPRAPKPGEHVRAIDGRELGDIFSGPRDRKMAAAEPAIRDFMSPINGSLRPLILYNPKYALNILGNGSMLVFDQGFIRSGQNLADAFSMDKWALEDDHTVFKNIMGAGKASSYLSGELGTKLGTISQGLADFWSKATDQNFRVASGLYYAKRTIGSAPEKFEGETFAEKLHDLLSNPGHEVIRDDVAKRGNDAMVAFDRMAPIEKAFLRHFIFVYPWQRGALIWSFRAIFEHPAKAALLATLGQEEYTEDTWLKTAPEWVRSTGYIPFHWVGDKVSVMNPTSINTFSTLGEILGTVKGLIEGDQYARFSDLFGPAGQFIAHAATGVDSFGNPYKGSQLLGAVEDTLNMLPAISSYRRSAKGAGEALREYDVSSRTGLSSVLTSAMKATALSPGWLHGWANVFIGGFNPRELNLTATAARYWVNAPAQERHQHQVDLIMRQMALQASFLKTGKVPSDQEVKDMLMAPRGSVKVAGSIPEDVRQAVLDAGQISYQAQIQSKNLGRNLTEKEQLLLSIKYYREAGRLPKADYNGLVTRAKGLDDQPDIKAMKAQVAMNYGNAKALYEWDRRVRIQNSFVDKQVGPANLAQRINVLYANGLANQKVANLNDDERGQYGHIYTKYITARDAYKATLTADKSLTGTQRSIRLAAFDSKHNEPVKIGGHTLPSVLALGTGANWDTASTDGSTDIAQRRLFLSATKNWYHLNSSEKEMFGQKSDSAVAEGWDHYWEALKEYRAGGNSVDANIRKQAAQWVTTNYAKGFMRDWTYSTKTPKIDRLMKSKMYATIPDHDTFDEIAAQAQGAAKAMADGTSTITQTRHDWKVFVNDKIMPALEEGSPKLYAWLQNLGPSFLTSLINTG